ncbi:carboxymuconolactone decarboxylase family protein [Streptomyces sp. NPDC014889]|uniref:carboxymuconolactone decarboxylase family protein n=1 Tax=Streptomyces sp. NPDC014889 TaxID=3364928 RepID=UPI0036F93A43
MEARLNYFGHPLAAKVLRHINSANKVLADSTLPPTVQELVKLRASQINGCGFCTDMHSKDAAHAGETQQRLNRTRIADAAGGATDEAWENAANHYDEDQLAALISLIAVINAYNRINVINQTPAGDYQPGQFG